MTIAYSVFDTSYAARIPYISTAEYQSAPQALDLNNLLAGGNAQANAIALQEAIGRASAWMDNFTQGAWGTLCSTLEIENARTWGTYRNTLSIHTKYWPITEVRTFSYSALPGGLASGNAASITPAGNVTIYPQSFEVAATGVVGWGLNAPAGIVRGVEYDTNWSYVAGWPNTTLSASVAAGAASIQPTSVVGIYPNSMLTLYDLPYDEAITVSSSYVPGAAIVPLSGNLQYNHATTATVTNLPPSIKQAAVWATTAFLKQRGSGALEVTDMGARVEMASGAPQNSTGDLNQAKMLLNVFKQQYIGY